MTKKKKQRGLGSSEQRIIQTLQTSYPGEVVKAEFKMHKGVAGYAIEVSREIMGEEYVYDGWVSAKVVMTDCEPWPADQRHMIDRAFQLAIQDALKGAN